MKKIGLLGGMSWESTITYYKIINEKIAAKCGGLHSADMVIRSLDLGFIEKHQRLGEWNAVAEILCTAACELEKLDVDFIVIASNTVHKVYDEVVQAVSVHVLHVADPTVEAVGNAGICKVGLLGTKYTMQGDFLKEKLNAAGMEVIVPDAEQIEQINDAIFNEACIGYINDSTRSMLREVVQALYERGAEGVILGCTELGLMISQTDSVLPLFDTAILHAEKAAEMVVGE